jgi:hypothetical protein
VKNHKTLFTFLNKSMFYLFTFLIFCSCNKTFNNEDEVKQWLSGKEFSSQNANFTTYDIYGKSYPHSKKLVIRFEGDKVQYENCLSATYDISKKIDDYEINFKIPCLDEYFTVIIKSDGKILTKSEIYDSGYAYNRSEYVENRPNAISKLDALSKLERKEEDGPELVLSRENIVISNKGVDTNTRVDNFRNHEVNWGTQRRIQATLDSDYANVITTQPNASSRDTTSMVANKSVLADSVALISLVFENGNPSYKITDKLPQSYCSGSLKFTFFRENGNIKVNCFEGKELYHTYTCKLANNLIEVDGGDGFFASNDGVLNIVYPDKHLRYVLKMCR